jgi:hypothetical protein
MEIAFLEARLIKVLLWNPLYILTSSTRIVPLFRFGPVGPKLRVMFVFIA